MQPREVADLRGYLAGEVDARQVEVAQAPEAAQERRQSAAGSVGGAFQIVPAKVKVPETREGEERGAYPADERRSRVVPAVVELGSRWHVPEAERQHVPGVVAAPDASPPAAVFLASSLPRGHDAPWVAADAVLEGQQRVPLLGQAARRHRQGVRGPGQSGNEDEQESGKSRVHGSGRHGDRRKMIVLETVRSCEDSERPVS